MCAIDGTAFGQDKASDKSLKPSASSRHRGREALVLVSRERYRACVALSCAPIRCVHRREALSVSRPVLARFADDVPALV